MGVYISNLFRFYSSMFQSHLHSQQCSSSVFSRGCHMVSITTASIPNNFCIDVRPSGFCVLPLLQYHHTCTFCNHKTAPIVIEWSRGRRRVIVILCCKRPRPCEARKCKRMDTGLGAPSNHNISVAKSDEARSISNRMCACRTSSRHSMIRTSQVVLHGYM